MKARLNFVPNEDYQPEENSLSAEFHKKDCVSFSELESALTTTESNIDVVDVWGNRTPVEADTVVGVTPKRADLLEKPTKLGEKLADEIESFELPEVVKPKLTHLIGEDGGNPTTVINTEEDLKKLEQDSTNG